MQKHRIRHEPCFSFIPHIVHEKRLLFLEHLLPIIHNESRQKKISDLRFWTSRCVTSCCIPYMENVSLYGSMWAESRRISCRCTILTFTDEMQRSFNMLAIDAWPLNSILVYVDTQYFFITWLLLNRLNLSKLSAFPSFTHSSTHADHVTLKISSANRRAAFRGHQHDLGNVCQQKHMARLVK